MNRYLPSSYVAEDTYAEIGRVVAEHNSAGFDETGAVWRVVYLADWIRSAILDMVKADLVAMGLGERWKGEPNEPEEAFGKRMPKIFCPPGMREQLLEAVEWRDQSVPGYTVSRYIRDALRQKLSTSHRRAK